MISDLRRQKFTRLFHLWDYNKDGVLQRVDFEQAALGIASFLGIQPGSVEMDTHMTAYMAGWEQVRQAAHPNGGDQVMLDEFVAATSQALADPVAFEAITMTSARNSIRLMDLDGDGRIARPEYLGVVMAYNMTNDEAEEAFRQLDRDGDGYITQEESVANTVEFFMSDDPQARGNWLFGPYTTTD